MVARARLQFAGGFLGKGNDENLIERDIFFGQEPQHQLLDGVGLAGAGGRFDDSVSAKLEGFHIRADFVHDEIVSKVDH